MKVGAGELVIVGDGIEVTVDVGVWLVSGVALGVSGNGFTAVSRCCKQPQDKQKPESRGIFLVTGRRILTH